MQPAKSVNDLLDDLINDPDMQRDWELNPTEVLKNYALGEAERQALLDGDVDKLIELGLAERHTKQMRVYW